MINPTPRDKGRRVVNVKETIFWKSVGVMTSFARGKAWYRLDNVDPRMRERESAPYADLEWEDEYDNRLFIQSMLKGTEEKDVRQSEGRTFK